MTKEELIELKRKLDEERRNKSKYIMANGYGYMGKGYT